MNSGMKVTMLIGEVTCKNSVTRLWYSVFEKVKVWLCNPLCRVGDLGYFKSTYSKRGCQERCRKTKECNAFAYDGKGFRSNSPRTFGHGQVPKHVSAEFWFNQIIWVIWPYNMTFLMMNLIKISLFYKTYKYFNGIKDTSLHYRQVNYRWMSLTAGQTSSGPDW